MMDSPNEDDFKVAFGIAESFKWKPNDDENFFRNSANRLTHTTLYLDAIPTVIQGIVPINSEAPDYSQKFEKFEEEELEQMSEEEGVGNRKDFSETHEDFSETENNLAEIWRKVLFLSEDRYQALNKSSDFFALAPSFCTTFEIILLEKEIERVFQISLDSIDLHDYSKLREQATMIDLAIERGKSCL